MRGADPSIRASVEWNAMACHGGELLFVSAMGSSADFKVITSVVNSNGSIPGYWNASGLNILKPSHATQRYRYDHNPGRLGVCAAGYDVHKHRLGFGEEHRLYVARKPGFMLVASDEAIWAELKSRDITTPLIREWLPYVAEKLIALGFLSECDVHPFEPAKPEEEGEEPSWQPEILTSCVMSGSTKDVDDIVMDGLRTGRITIPGSEEYFGRQESRLCP